jgi:hypothetical protein
MNVNEIKLWVEFQLNKNQSGNTLNKEEYNSALNMANLEYFKLKYGLPEEYRPGQPLPRQAWSVTQENIDALSPFLMGKGGRDLPQLKIDSNGYATIPTGYVHHSSIRYNGRSVEVVSNDVFGDRIQSPIVFPDEKYPICTFYAGYIQFEPKALGYVNMDYLRLPVTPIWAATIVNDEYVYNPAGSTQLEWGEVYHMDIANLVLKYASVNIRDFQMTQLANQRQDKGL